MSVPALWAVQTTTRSARDLALVEAELGARGQTGSGAAYLGQRTSAAYGTARYTRTRGGVSDLDCADFPSAAAAQGYFLNAGGPALDPNNLDADGDGLACEWGVELRRIAAGHSVPRAPAQPRYRSAYCHVGPRGGTYTITASGRKNYDGC
jgi:hypothetical protein